MALNKTEHFIPANPHRNTLFSPLLPLIAILVIIFTSNVWEPPYYPLPYTSPQNALFTQWITNRLFGNLSRIRAVSNAIEIIIIIINNGLISILMTSCMYCFRGMWRRSCSIGLKVNVSKRGTQQQQDSKKHEDSNGIRSNKERLNDGKFNNVL